MIWRAKKGLVQTTDFQRSGVEYIHKSEYEGDQDNENPDITDCSTVPVPVPVPVGWTGDGPMRGPGKAIHDAMTSDFNDADGNGIVTKDEFVAATEVLFGLIDRTGDGLMTPADFGMT